MKDYYKILGATPLDTKEKIQETYRSVSRHLRDMPEKEQRNIIAAFNLLSDEDKRKEYDSQPQFQIRKSSPTLANVGTKKKESEKVPFRWGIPIMEILLMPFKGENKQDQNEPGAEEKTNIHFTQGVLMAEDPKMVTQAKGEFESVVSLMPTLREGLYNLGLVNYRLGKYAEALNNFKKCIEIESKDNHARKMVLLLE